MAVHVKSGNNTEQQYDEATSFVVQDGILYVLDGRDATQYQELKVGLAR